MIAMKAYWDYSKIILFSKEIMVRIKEYATHRMPQEFPGPFNLDLPVDRLIDVSHQFVIVLLINGSSILFKMILEGSITSTRTI